MLKVPEEQSKGGVVVRGHDDPAGHGVQEAAPEVEYMPEGHGIGKLVAFEGQY